MPLTKAAETLVTPDQSSLGCDHGQLAYEVQEHLQEAIPLALQYTYFTQRTFLSTASLG